MLSNAASMSQYALFDKRKGTYPILTGLEFAERVKSRGVWDYKQTYKDLYLYNGRYLTGESIGNMHYGFVGRASTFSQTLLRSAAGAYQIASKTSKGEWASSYFDDPQDQVMINQGMGFWDNSNLPSTINTLNEMHIENYLAAQLTAEEIKVIEEEFLKDYEEYMSQQQLEK